MGGGETRGENSLLPSQRQTQSAKSRRKRKAARFSGPPSQSTEQKLESHSKTEGLSNRWRLQSYLPLERSPTVKTSFFDWLCCSIQSGNILSWGRRTSNHHISVGICYWQNWTFCLVSLQNQRGFERGARWDVNFPVCSDDYWLPVITLPLWFFCLLPACWLLKVYVCPSVGCTIFHFFIRSWKKRNSWKEFKWSSDKSCRVILCE